jgi:2-aminoadipate transaminase
MLKQVAPAQPIAQALAPALREASGTPLYRQIQEQIRSLIDAGRLRDGDRLPPTRELAESLRLNRATVAAAYRALEQDGLLRGHVGRGSFVNAQRSTQAKEPDPSGQPWPAEAAISFSTSRPSEQLFPIGDFRRSAREVLDGDLAAILQLGSPFGYEPFRHYLLARARERREAGPGDDVVITSGCQQAIDLLQRVLAPAGSLVMVEDPVYPGLRETFRRAGARLTGIPVAAGGLDLDALERALRRDRPALLVVTPDFQNPTGATMPLDKRRALLRVAAAHEVTIVENAAYSALRYDGEPIAPLKQLDRNGNVIQIGSFSKVAFPGLRLGWIAARRRVAERCAEAKQWADLHSDQLSQAILLRFLESGRMEAHCRKVIAAGRERLDATIRALEAHAPGGTSCTRPQGGMNLWVRLPEGADADEILPKAIAAGVSFLPARYFAVAGFSRGGLRLSFAGLTPDEIDRGVRTIGTLAARALRAREIPRMPHGTAIV